MTEQKILICYNAPTSVYSSYTGKENNSNTDEIHDMSEIGFADEIHLVEDILKQHYSFVETLPVTLDIESAIKKMREFAPDAILNFVEAVEGRSTFESAFAGLYELLDTEYTGNTTPTLANCLDKAIAKRILSQTGVPTAPFEIIEDLDQAAQLDLKFPIILKLLKEDASIGISERSVVHSAEQLMEQTAFLLSTYSQAVIAEEFIAGREFNVALLNGKVLPISEIDFTGLDPKLPNIVTYEGKWVEESDYYKHTTPKVPADIDSSLRSLLEDTALQAYRAMDCRDYARVDIRLSQSGIPYVIEVNPNPDISSTSGFVRACKAAGVSFDEMILFIVDLAVKRSVHQLSNAG